MKIIIAGAGKVGSHLAKMLSREANDITVLDDSQKRIDSIVSSLDVNVIKGKVSSVRTLQQAGIDQADLFISVYPSESQEINITSSLIAKKLGARKVLARINEEEFLDPENKLMFKEMGIELMFYPEKIAADEIVAQLKQSSALESMDFAHGKLRISVFKLDEDSPVLDMKLIDFMRKLSPQEARQFRVIAVSRNNETIVPGSDTQFLYGDQVFTVATREGEETVLRIFGKKNIAVSRVMILGGTEISTMAAEQLSHTMSDVKIIDNDKEVCLQLTETLPDNVQVVCGDGRNPDFLYEEGIKDYDAFVALTDSDEVNILACVVARKFGVDRTIAEVENVEYLNLAEDMGVDNVINKKLITAGRIFKYTLSGKARFVRYMSGTSAEVIEYTVAPDSAITRGPIKDIKLPKDVVIGGIVRGSDALIAVGDTVIEAYDRVAVFAMPDSVSEMDKLFKTV